MIVSHAGLFVSDADSFCVPTAIASLTGIETSKIEDKILELRNRPEFREIEIATRKRVSRTKVVGVLSLEIEPVIEALGWKAVSQKKYALKLEMSPKSKKNMVTGTVDHRRLPSITHVIRKDIDPDKKTLVLVTGHVLAYTKGFVADTYHKTPVPIEKYKSKKRVWEFWYLEKKENENALDVS